MTAIDVSKRNILCIDKLEQRGGWELAAALAVLERAHREMVRLRETGGDRQVLQAAEHRYGSAQRIVERIRATLSCECEQGLV